MQCFLVGKLARAAVLVAVFTPAAPALAQADAARSMRLATLKCYDEKAADLDDGASDARTVGAAVSLACYEFERQEMQFGMKSGELETTRHMAHTKDTAITRASSVVLARRVKAKNARN